MHKHFHEHVNVERLIREAKPQHVLELGSLKGANTKLLWELAQELDFLLTVISDDIPEAQGPVWGGQFLRGVSYQVLPTLADQSIDVALIDTDHNYWTLYRELLALHPKLSYGALVVIHDVDTYYYDTGLAIGYADGTPYPRDEIVECADRGGIGTLLMDFLSAYKHEYQLRHWTPESEGAAVIRKNLPGLRATVIQTIPPEAA